MEKQRGVALLIAVLIISLIVTISTVINTYLSIDLELVKFMVISDDLQGYSPIIQSKFMNDYRKNVRDFVNKIDDRKFFNNGVHEYKDQSINAHSVGGKIIDQYGLFNLNYLYDPAVCKPNNQPPDSTDPQKYIMRTIFKGLMEMALRKVNDNYDSELLVLNTQKWLCPENNSEINQAYLSKDPPYVHAGQPFISITELKLVDGITEELWDVLKDYISAWPVSDKKEIVFNPATIRPQILTALLGQDEDMESYKESDLQQAIIESSNFLILQRSEEDKRKFQQFVKESLFKDTKKLLSMGYKFLVVSKVKKASNLLALYTMLSLRGNDFEVLWRSRSSY